MKWFPSLGLAAIAALLPAAGGCHSGNQPPVMHGENFAPDDQPHAVQNISAAQVATGARADATLYVRHFNDAGLNSLGRQKLELMIRDEEASQPLVVYLDLPATTSLAPLHQAVAEYLKSRGLPENQIKLVDGPNPQTLHSAADTVTALTALQQSQTPAGPQGAAAAGPQQSTGGYSPLAPPPSQSDYTNH